MMPMDDKRAAFSYDFDRRGFGGLVETSLLGITLELFGRLASSSWFKVLFGRFRLSPFRVDRRCVSGDCFPRISVLRHSLGHAVKIECLRAFNRTQFLPLQWS